MTDYQILHGDVLDQLATLPAASVHCVVTSPPYWGLRNYGTACWMGGDPACDHRPGNVSRVGKTTLGGGTAMTGHQHEGYPNICRKCGAVRMDRQIGLEPTPAEYVARLVEVFAAVWRVLRDDGTLWLNLGDSYAGSGVHAAHHANPGMSRAGERGADVPTPVPPGLKPKDLVGIPWRVAFALQDAGWYLRSDIIWAKPNPMPESVTDRPTKSHEYLFLLTKSAHYFYDAEAIREPQTGTAHGGGNGKRPKSAPAGSGIKSNTSFNEAMSHYIDVPGGRNRRSVWTIATEPYPEAHFATFPTKLVEPCILAGTSAHGCCSVCGAPWERVIEPTGHKNHREPAHVPNNSNTKTDSTGWQPTTRATENWQPTCMCGPREPIPCTVLDPFLGSGTTIAVAVGLGRHGIGIELNASYVELARDRIVAVQRPLVTL